jgi:uncharacterized protein involved in exopolysaccharide biosynthesis
MLNMSDSNKTPEGNPDSRKLPSSGGSADGEIDLVETLRKYLFPHWKKYCVAAFVGAVVLASLTYLITPRYKAEVASLVNVSSSSSLLKGSLGGLASLAGMNLNSGDSSAMFNINYVSSRELADAFIAKYDLRHELFYKRYDENGVYKNGASLNKFYVKLLGPNYAGTKDDDVYLTPGPSKEQLYKAFERVFVVNVDQKKMTVTVAVTWMDPIKAKQWANDYIGLANDILKHKAMDESRLKIKYLESQIKEKPEVEVQQAIYSLIENEMKQIAVAESTDQYAFKITQRAYLPERKASPKRWNFLFGGAFLGAFSVFTFLFLPKVLVGAGIRKQK